MRICPKVRVYKRSIAPPQSTVGGEGDGGRGVGGDREKGYSVSVESSLNHVQNETKNGRKQKTKQKL